MTYDDSEQTNQQTACNECWWPIGLHDPKEKAYFTEDGKCFCDACIQIVRKRNSPK